MKEYNNLISDVLNFIKDKNYRIYGFGEATHGSLRNFEFRFEMFKRMVKENLVNVFFLEDHYDICDLINDYIFGKTNEWETPFSALMYPFKNKIMIKLIKWMKKWNQNNNNKIYFYGGEVQKIEYKDNKQPYIQGIFKDKAYVFINGERSIIDKKDLNLELLNSKNNKIIKKFKELVNQMFLEDKNNNFNLKKYDINRDKYTFEFFEHRDKPTNKYFMWMHNFHLDKKGNNTFGYFLDKNYKNEFVNFNNAFYNGNLYWPRKNETFHLKPHMKDQLIYPALKIIYETDENIKIRTEKKKIGSADATIFIDNEKPLEWLRDM